MIKNIALDEALWDRAAAAMVHRAFELVAKGVLTPPITCRISECGDDEDQVIFEAIILDRKGSVEVGNACPIHVDRTVFLPLRFVFDDGVTIHSALFEVPVETVQ